MEGQLAAAQRNLAIEEVPELRDAVREEFQRINDELKTVRSPLEKVQQTRPKQSTRSIEQEVDAAIGLFDQIRQVANDEQARAAVTPLVERLGLHIGLRFVEAVKGKKRRVRRLASGVIGFGNILRSGQSHQSCGQPNRTHQPGPQGNAGERSRSRIRQPRPIFPGRPRLMIH